MAKKKSLDIFNEIASLVTEQVNTNTTHIDELASIDIAQLINNEDKLVALAVEQALPDIALAIDLITASFQKGGRLIYVGAGTSGRLGILDASECPPTFGTPASMVQGVIAGGKQAVFRAVEGAEDDATAARDALRKLHLTKHDTLCGISASKRTPFVLGALAFAQKTKASTIFLTSNPNTPQNIADVIIKTVVGPEAIMGSTRMKAGSSHKMVLNMLTSGAMIRIGKTYGNLMVDMKPTNKKLEERAKRIFMIATAPCSYEEATLWLSKAKGNLKVALAMRLANLSYQDATKELTNAQGKLKQVVD